MRRAALLIAALAPASCLSFHQGPMPGEPNSAQFSVLNGVRVRTVDVGQGPAVVLIHGFASSLETWSDVIPALEPTHRVLALDLMGFGWSDRPDADYSPDAEAKLVRALLDERGIERAALVAHSWGASVALALALESPERVTRLALYDAFVYDDQLNTFFRMARVSGLGEALFALWYKARPEDKLALAFYEPERISQPFVDAVEAALERPGTTAAALAAVRGQRFLELEPHYREVEVPALILWGRDDRVTPLSVGERLSKELPNARLVVYPRCGHFPTIEADRASTAELVRFLAEDAR
jgi:pimeloyl-ACP methyl ester carboxylesterase